MWYDETNKDMVFPNVRVVLKKTLRHEEKPVLAYR